MKKVISMLLVLCAFAICLASCASSNNKDPGQENPETEREYMQKDYDFEGYEFTVLSLGDGNSWSSRTIVADEIISEPINDAVYVRNNVVCTKYNFTISNVAIDRYQYVNNAKVMLNMEDEVDLCVASMRINTALLEKEDLLLNLYDPRLTGMDLSKPWYDQNSINSLTVNGQVYAITGDMIVMDDDSTQCTYFNKKLAEKYEVEDLYAAVKEGRWTLDLLADYAAKATVKLDGTTETMNPNDQWGFLNEMWSVNICLAGGNYPIAKIGADGKPELNCFTKDYNNAWVKCMEVLDGPTSIVWQHFAGCDLSGIFTEGRGLFLICNICSASQFQTFTEMEDDFGILPIPKLDVNQENYSCNVKLKMSESIAIPALSTNPERTSAIIEALSEESHYTLVPAYYDVTLMNKKTRDDQSQDMLDIIFSTKSYDIGEYYDWGGIYTSVGDTLQSSSSFTVVTKRKTIAETELKDFVAKRFA